MGALTVTLPQSGFSVQGNRRVHRGTLTGSTSYATSGDTYTTRNFGFNVVDFLVVYPAGGYIPSWNSAGTTVIFRRDTFTRTLQVDGVGATAGAVMRLGYPGIAPSIGVAVQGSILANLTSTGSTGTDITTQISTSDTTVVTVHYNTGSMGLALYALTGGQLMTTATLMGTNFHFISLSDGSLIPVSNDATAGQRLLFTDSASTGLMIRVTSTVDINIAASTTLSLGSIREVASGTNLSGVTFHWIAEGI